MATTPPLRISLDEIKTISAKVARFFEEMKKCFISRDNLINLFMLSLLQRQHMLVFGKPGTAKSKVGDTIMNSIMGAERFEIQLTRFTTEDAVFGPYNIKRMRAEGILEHNVDGMLPQAQFAFLNEFLDANEPLLRSLLGSLQERKYRKGRQIIEMPLHTAYCDTNTDPFVFLQQNPNAFAVLDRIMFMTNVDYLSTSEEIAQMVKMHQEGRYIKQIGVNLELAEINALAEVIVCPPSLFRDELIFTGYAEALVEYTTERSKLIEETRKVQTSNAPDFCGIILPDISDRRKVFASEVMETAAVLDGRVVVEPRDMLQCKYALGSSKLEFDLWERIAGVKVKHLEGLRAQSGADVRMIVLNNIKASLAKLASQTKTTDDLELFVQELGTTRIQLTSVAPENEEERKIKETSQEELERIMREVSPLYLDKRLSLEGAKNGTAS